jgi:ABC-type antimicrobial peptide transport system permease subunit
MAVGATPQDLLRDVLRQGGVLVVAGVGIGVVLAIVAARGLAQALFDTTPWDPSVFASAVLLLAVTGLLSCLLPGMRAARLDPRTAINTE